jgi:DNA-binding transcriptional LysR family regulator
MRFTLRQIEYFIAAGELGSITLASERVKISQPSISTAISHLENELGTQLFVRHHAQGLSLTPTGRVLLAEAKRLIQQAENLYASASDLNDQIRGQLSLGCLVTVASMVMPELSHSFTSKYPATQVRHQVSDHEQLLESLRRAEIDVAITYDLLIPENFGFQPLVALPPHVLIGKSHPLARRTSLTLKELAAEPFILLDLPISREYFLSLFLKDGLEPRIAERSTHQDAIRTMVANGYGYTLANARPRSDIAMDGRPVKRVELSGKHRPMILGLTSLRERRKSRLIEAFESHCKSFISETHIPGMVAPGAKRRRSR